MDSQHATGVTIPAELTLVLRRTLFGEYVLAAERASRAAEECLEHERRTDATTFVDELAADLVKCRNHLHELEDLFDLLGDDLVEGDAVDVPEDRRGREQLVELIDRAIDDTEYMNGEMSPDADLIITTARLLERLQSLRAELEPQAVTA
jgi:hypothetical protein